MSASDDLHEHLFGFRPAKEGTAYERLAAMVLAGLGWENVNHGTKVRPAGKRAGQQLDVTAKSPDGSIRRLLVECKDWDKKVCKPTVDTLVGVQGQVGFDAAMVVTTVGFSSGAVDVAVDEDVAMVILREFRPGDGPFVRDFELKVGLQHKAFEGFDLDIDLPRLPDHGELKFKFEGPDRLLHLDGSPAETVGELIRRNGAKLSEGQGVFECAADLAPGRLLAALDGTQVPITAIRWRETVRIDGSTISRRATGEPCLVLEQLDDKGEPQRSRLVVDDHLNAWDIDADGEVISRSELL